MLLQHATPTLILASASASRRDLLRAAGLDFEVLPADINEAVVKELGRSGGQTAEQVALQLAELKARQVARGNPDALIIGADQILVCDGVWFDKPADEIAARKQLLALRDRTHELATAVACVHGSELVWHYTDRPRLTMRWFSENFLDGYLAAEGDSVTSTVGAYRVEGLGIHLFERLEGSQASILGLPLLPLLAFLREKGAVVG